MKHINWSGISNASVAGRLLRLPLALIPGDAIMRIRGGGAARDLRWIAGAATHGCWLGSYELEKQLALKRFVQPGSIVYDIGAQAGFYTMLFARMAGSAGKVIAFEPSPRELRFLHEHIRINRFGNVTIVAAAVSDRTGLSAFTTDRGATMNSLCADGATSLTVATISLDAAALPPPDLIKMDVEGAESRVLEGAAETLQRHRPVVFVALHSEEQRHRCADLLHNADYALYDLAGRAIHETPDTDEIYALPNGRSQAAR